MVSMLVYGLIVGVDGSYGSQGHYLLVCLVGVMFLYIAVFYNIGTSLVVANTHITSHSVLTLNADKSVEFRNDASDGTVTDILILQGKPINEQVAQYGPFVMNTADEIRQAQMDYARYSTVCNEYSLYSLR